MGVLIGNFLFLLLLNFSFINAQQIIKKGSLLRVDIRNNVIDYTDTIWNWEESRYSDKSFIDECLNIFYKNDILYLLTSHRLEYFYFPGIGSTSYKILNSSSKKEFNVASFGSVVDVIGEPYMNQLGKVVVTDNGFWFLGGAFLPSIFFDENDSTYQFNSRSETRIRFTHILGRIGEDYLIAVRREWKSNEYDFFLSDFSSLPSLSIGKKVVFKNSKDSNCTPEMVEWIQDSLYIIKYECSSTTELALFSKDTLKTILENYYLPGSRLIKNSELIYTEYNSSTNSYDLFKSKFNRETLLCNQRRILFSGLPQNTVFDSTFISWINNDSLFVFNFNTDSFVNRYYLNGVNFKPIIFKAYPYIFLDQILLVTNLNNEFELTNNFSLSQNYPNPFNSTTTIKYTIPNVGSRHASTLQHVTLKVYDILGREVATLVDEYKLPGFYNCELRIENGELQSGIYLYNLRVGSFSQTKKMVYLK